MSFIKNRFNRVFCKSRTVFPISISSRSNKEFCNSEIHDPLFDCCFGLELELEQMHSYDGRFVKNTKQGKKRKKVGRPISNNSCTILCRSKTFPIRSKSTNNLSSEELFAIKSCSPISVENLCSQLDGMGITTPRVTKLYTQIPEHDKKILKRMALKRKQEIARLEVAWIARKCWEDERTARNNLINQHSLKYSKNVQEKQRMESLQTERRINDLARKEQIYLDEIKKNINVKEERLIQRLQHVALKRETINRKRQLEVMKKFEAAVIIQKELQLDEELRKQECYSNLENRINRAEELRNKHLSTRQRQLCIDNDFEQNLHAANYDEAKKNESFKLEQLRLKIQEQNEKSIRFMEGKQRYLTESRNQARASAELRALVRNSISPDSYRSYRRSACDRPISNMSFHESQTVKKLN